MFGLDEVKELLKAQGHDEYAYAVEKAKRNIDEIKHIVDIEAMASNAKVSRIKEIIDAEN